MRYAVTITKSLEYSIRANTTDEACALAIAVATGEATRRVQGRVVFEGKGVQVESCSPAGLSEWRGR